MKVLKVSFGQKMEVWNSVFLSGSKGKKPFCWPPRSSIIIDHCHLFCVSSANFNHSRDATHRRLGSEKCDLISLKEWKRFLKVL